MSAEYRINEEKLRIVLHPDAIEILSSRDELENLKSLARKVREAQKAFEDSLSQSFDEKIKKSWELRQESAKLEAEFDELIK